MKNFSHALVCKKEPMLFLGKMPRQYIKNEMKQKVFDFLSVHFVKLIILLLILVELQDFKTRRISHFKKNLVDLAELELKHARVSTFLCINPLGLEKGPLVLLTFFLFLFLCFLFLPYFQLRN